MLRKKLLPPLLFALLVVYGLSNEQPTDERILDYKMDIIIGFDGILDITEQITVSSKGIKIQRGIYRDFRTNYRDTNGNIYRALLEVGAIMKDGSPTPYIVEDVPNGKRIRIGESDVFLENGTYTYTLNYSTNDQIGLFKDFDKLYFNAIGHGWNFSIDKIKVNIQLPEGAKVLQNAAYTGMRGEKGLNYSVKMKDNKIRYDNIDPFDPNEGLTIAVAWSKGFIAGSENYRKHETMYFESEGLEIMYIDSEGWEKSDKLLDIPYDRYSSALDEEMQNLLNPDKFLIKLGFVILDTQKIEIAIFDSLSSMIEELEKKITMNEMKRRNVPIIDYVESGWDELIFSFYQLSDDGDYYEIRTTRFGIVVNVDSSIELNYDLQDMIWNTLQIQLGLKRENFPELIIFKSVDIKELISEKKNKQPSLNRDDIYDDSWAVIIGIDNYQNLTSLDYAVEDAESVKTMLVDKFDYPEENVKLLVNDDANKTNIVNVISDVSLKAGENDRILVFFAGHGETMPLPDGGEMGYLLPIDGNQENLFASAIPMDDLKRLSNVSKAKHMLFLVDACYGGLAAVGSRSLEPSKTPNYIEKISNIKSRQIITAGGKNEEVFEKSEWGHSAYTKNLLSALEDGYADSNEDGYITADELGDYLSEKVSIDSENQQTPQSRRLTSHEGEFIFIYSENTFVNQSIENKSTDNKLESFDEKLDSLITEINDLKLQKESEGIVVKKEIWYSYVEDKYLIHELNGRAEISDFYKNKKEEVKLALINNPPKSSHSFSTSFKTNNARYGGYHFNKYFRNSNKAFSIGTFVKIGNDLHNNPKSFSDFSFSLGMKNYTKKDREGFHWGYNLTFFEEGIRPYLEIGYNLKYFFTRKYENEKKKTLPFFVIFEFNIYPENELFSMPVNEFYKYMAFAPRFRVDFPISWWNMGDN